MSPVNALLFLTPSINLSAVDDELVKVVRISNTDTTSEERPPPPRSLRGRAPTLSSDFSQQVLSGVRFAPLVPSPSLPTTIRSRVWEPSAHSSYPESFRRSCKTILLCAQSPEQQPPPEQPKELVNAASKLPRALWMEILSFTHRGWFEQPRSDEEFLRQRLLEEQDNARRAQEARVRAEANLHMMERERDIYRMLAMRWQARLRRLASSGGTASAHEEGDANEDLIEGVEDLAQIAAAVSSNEPIMLNLSGLTAMLRRFQADSEDDDDDDEPDEDDESDEEAMEADAEDSVSAMEEASEAQETEPMSIAALSVRQQARAVSISQDDR